MKRRDVDLVMTYVHPWRAVCRLCGESRYASEKQLLKHWAREHVRSEHVVEPPTGGAQEGDRG